jgi:hypothetical protein
MAIADGYCFRPNCRNPVPSNALNKFFCSDACREEKLKETLEVESIPIEKELCCHFVCCYPQCNCHS